MNLHGLKMTLKQYTVYQINQEDVLITLNLVSYQGESIYSRIKQILEQRGYPPIRELYFHEGSPTKQEIRKNEIRPEENPN